MNGLIEFNESQAGDARFKEFGIFASDESEATTRRHLLPRTPRSPQCRPSFSFMRKKLAIGSSMPLEMPIPTAATWLKWLAVQPTEIPSPSVPGVTRRVWSLVKT